jgi:NADPH-dependent curcumin reductase CurA
MPEQINRQIVLAAYPQGAPKDSDFQLMEGPVPVPNAGQVLCRAIYLSLDPYMRGRISPAKSYAKGVGIGEVITGGTVSQVIQSKSPDFAEGDIVFGYTGWQDYAVMDAGQLRMVDPRLAPISTALGVLGMPGMTAYTGLANIGKPQKGEILVVAAASGAVGSAVGQIAKIKGCRTIGIAGSSEKCAFVVDELGFDVCLNHRNPDFAAQLKSACPDGVDIYWENVGGAVFQALLPLCNDFARIPVCGLVAHANATALPSGPNHVPGLMRAVLVNRLHIQGFIVWDYAAQEAEFMAEMSRWIGEGRVKYREDFVDGLEYAVGAFQGLLQGRNFGKLVVRVSPDPTVRSQMRSD